MSNISDSRSRQGSESSTSGHSWRRSLKFASDLHDIKANTGEKFVGVTAANAWGESYRRYQTAAVLGHPKFG